MTPSDASGGKRRPKGAARARRSQRLRRLLGDWRIVVPLAAAPLVLVAATLWTQDSGSSEAQPAAGASATEGARRNQASAEEPPRPSHQSGDTPAEELAATGTLGLIGEPALSGGLTVTVTEAAVTQETRGRDHLVIFVTLGNDSDDPQPYGLDGFSLIAERGAVVQAVPSQRQDALEAGTVDAGQSLSGTMLFPAGAGTHTLVYEPAEGGETSRIVWVVQA